jgi:hypothetical protein
MRPDVGTQAQFKKKKPPVTYRYDSSLSPALDWDGQNSARERGEKQLAVLASELAEVRRLVAQGSPSSPAALPVLGKSKQVEKPSRSIGTLQGHLSKAEEAIQNLKAISKPFLNWAGKIVPHVTLKSIANNEPPEEEVLVDRPETDNKITRVTGAFCVEGTIPTPVDLEARA